ncbi:MAG: hypothetical protein RR764_09945 [Oscillospiraceae bacterium]
MTAIISAMTDAFGLVTKIIEQVCAQPVLLFCLAASLIPVGIGIFRQLRHSVM